MKVLVGTFYQEMALVASRGLLNDCVNFADGSFAALLQSCGEGDSTMETITHLLLGWGWG